jgi:quercetin dioxygenase-like cupin family protein
MQVKRFSEAKPYEAPNHRGYSSLRLFGAEAGGTQTLIVGLSHFLPGGGAGPDASPPEKVYIVLAGELTVIVGGKETVLKQYDSCVIGPNESREIINRGNEVCTIAVAVAPVDALWRGPRRMNGPGRRPSRLPRLKRPGSRLRVTVKGLH